MGAVSRGGRQSGFNMGAAQDYYADMMQRQPRRGFNFTRDPDTSPGLSYDRRTFRQRAEEARKNREARVKEFEDRQAAERADYEARYPQAPPTVGTPRGLTDVGVEQGENPLLSAPAQKSPFASDSRYGAYGIAYRPEYEGYAFYNPGDPNVGKEGTPGGYFGLYGSLDDAEKYLQKMIADKKADPDSYQYLDYDSAGKRVGFDPTKEKSSTGTLLEDPSAVKERQESTLINVPRTPTSGGSEPDYKMGDDPDKVYMMGGPEGPEPGRDAEFQKFLDKAKADKEAFMAKIRSEEEGFGQKIKGERAAAFKEFRDKSRAKAEEFRSLRGRRGTPGGFGGSRRGTPGGFGGSFGDPNARPFTGDFSGGRLAGGGVRGTRWGRWGRSAGCGGGRVRGAR